jgi:1,4-alpha-glucan branching enzyme
MVSWQCINRIHEWRSWGFDWQDSKLNRLAHIERKVQDFLTNEQVASERRWLVQSICQERLDRVVTRILCPNRPNSIVENIESTRQKLSQLIGQLERDASGHEAQSTFQELPMDVRDLFYWSIWIHHGALYEDKFGEKKLAERLSLLDEIQTPLLCLKGKKLCEQMFQRYEILSVLEKQRNTVQLLQKISEKIHSPLINCAEVQFFFTQLPSELQWHLHEDVYTFSAQRTDEPQWGEKEIRGNPKCLVYLHNPSQGSASLIEQHLQEQMDILRNLEKMKEVEDFDRLTSLYNALNQNQWQALLSKVSPTVREWISIIESRARQKGKLFSDTRHLYQWRGAHPKIDGTHVQVFAPHARQVKLILTAFGKEEYCIAMEQKNFGLFETHTSHANPGRTYRFLIEDCHGNWNYRTDPFSFSVIDTGSALESVVTEIEGFDWNDQQWMQERSSHHPCEKPFSIYEIHVDFWKKQQGKSLSFRELAWAIVEYQQKIPFTHIQIYGVLDHKNVDSWGYQIDHFFAPNRRLGDADDLKFLIDLCHQRGIGVIIDWIAAHYKHGHDGDSSQSLHNFDGTDLFGSESSDWGTLFFDFNKDETKRLLLANALYWFEKMHVDGLRVDAVSPMIFRNGNAQCAAIDFLKDLNRIVHEQYHGIVMIAETTDGYPNVTKSTFEGGLGFDVKLGIHMQWRTRNYFRTPYEQRGWDEHIYGKLLSNLKEIGEGEQWFITHSHDDAASGDLHRHSTIYGSIPTKDSWRKFADMRLFHAWNLLSPGCGHGIHMGDEIGQRWPWNERLQASEGAVEWHLLDNHLEAAFHRGLQECVGDLNRLYRSRPAFWKQGSRGYQLISHFSPNKVIGIHRFDYEGQRLALFFNFSPNGYREYHFPLAPLHKDPELRWIKGAREVFNTDGIQYGGTGEFRNTWASIIRDGKGHPTHFCLALPPLSAVIFEETW